MQQFIKTTNVPGYKGTSNRQEVSEHRGHPCPGIWQNLIWGLECLMFGYFLPATCTRVPVRVSRARYKYHKQSWFISYSGCRPTFFLLQKKATKRGLYLYRYGQNICYFMGVARLMVPPEYWHFFGVNTIGL